MTQESFLPYVTKPGRYLGKEYNSICKKWQQTDVRFALVFPDLYEIGMSHLGLQILYHIINARENYLAERCFSPDIDAEKVMEAKKLPLQTLESNRPLRDFDIVGITLPYELCYTNILTILNLGNIPFYSHSRGDSDPIILGGGSCSLNPEPVADFFDAILLGDGEEAVVEIAAVVAAAKKAGGRRRDIIDRLATIEGVYIPARFSPPSMGDSCDISTVENQQTVTRRIVSDLGAISHLCAPIVPNAKIVHDRLGVEIARGCTRGCRFCQAGMIYRPVRERSIDEILHLAEEGIRRSGFEELALLSLSSGDYSCIDTLLPKLMDRFEQSYVSVSLPSMRVGTLSPAVMDQIKRVRKSGFTVAPEAGSERLREVINKGITEADLIKTCEDAFAMGWNTIKLYFMIGLPTETHEDIEAIALLVKRIQLIAKNVGGRRKQVTASVGTFVPKPHTPFQWEQQLSLEQSRERIASLKALMPAKGAKLKWHNPEMSFLEGVFSRGDRSLTPLIEAAWSLGARFDGWSEHFNLSLWRQAAQKCSIRLEDFLGKRPDDRILPWDHLQSGMDPAFLKEELARSTRGVYTPDCRYNGCQDCGLCDFETIRPVVRGNSPDRAQVSELSHAVAQRPTNDAQPHYKYMVSYSRRGNISYLGHLEILQLIFRSLRRAGIRTHFSRGFNPSPKISFGSALPVGLESEAEFFIMDLPEPLTDLQKTLDHLNSCLPPGLFVNDIDLHEGKIPQSIINSYSVQLPRELTDNENSAIADYLDTDCFFVSRRRKNEDKDLDIRPLVKEMSLTNGRSLSLRIKAMAGAPGIKVQEALIHILAWPEIDVQATRILKTSWQEYTES